MMMPFSFAYFTLLISLAQQIIHSYHYAESCQQCVSGTSLTSMSMSLRNHFLADYIDHCAAGICPNNQLLSYSTTNRDGYREYKSKGHICVNCPYLNQCTESREHVKVVTRHVWQDYIDICEDIRHTSGMKEIYSQRKHTIERDFGTAKEHHAMRYTQLVGKAKMSMKVGLTFACLNMKKLARLLDYREKQGQPVPIYSHIQQHFAQLFMENQILTV
jgi:hypothetical protein